MKIFHVEVPIFGSFIICCTGCDRDDAEHAFYTYQDARARIDIPDGASGAVGAFDSNVYMWVEDPYEEASTVFHELIHVAQVICELKGMDMDPELIAYLGGWLKNSVADVIWHKSTKPVVESTEEVADGI